MSCSYLEFNSEATKFVNKRREFFTQEYGLLHERTSAVQCDGLTNYERVIARARVFSWVPTYRHHRC